jgi:hypothetical protein
MDNIKEERRMRAAALLRTTLAREWAAATALKAPPENYNTRRVGVSVVIKGDAGRLKEPL